MADEKTTNLGIRWSGEKSDDPQVVGEILSNLGGLLEELTEAVTGSRDSIQWQIGRIRIVCDGEDCERERPEDHADWVRRDGLDFCPHCQRAA